MQTRKPKKLGQQPPLPGMGHHCRAAVHLDAMVMVPTAARNQVSDPRESESVVRLHLQHRRSTWQTRPDNAVLGWAGLKDLGAGT